MSGTLSDYKKNLLASDRRVLDMVIEKVEDVGGSVTHMDGESFLRVGYHLYPLAPFIEACRRSGGWPEFWMQRVKNTGLATTIQ